MSPSEVRVESEPDRDRDEGDGDEGARRSCATRRARATARGSAAGFTLKVGARRGGARAAHVTLRRECKDATERLARLAERRGERVHRPDSNGRRKPRRTPPAFARRGQYQG